MGRIVHPGGWGKTSSGGAIRWLRAVGLARLHSARTASASADQSLTITDSLW
jgi:hypothetical protein